jgi:hypothetical protein
VPQRQTAEVRLGGTPLHPYPQPETTQQPRDEKPYPPELGADAIAILEGRMFMLSNAVGDGPPGSIGGLHNDTRFLSGWELTLAGRAADDGVGERVVVRIAVAAARWCNAGGQPIGVPHRQVLRAAVAVLHQAIGSAGATVVDRLLKGIEHKIRAARRHALEVTGAVR